jgi:hypothetical protein
MILILTILFLLIPKRIYEYDFNQRYKNSKFKHVYNALIIFKAIITIFIGSSIIKEVDYVSYNIYYFIVGFLFVSLLVSRLRNSEIIELSTWLVIVAILLYLLAFLHMVPFDISLLRVFKFEVPDISFYLLTLLIYSDNLLILLANKEKYKVKKKSIIFPIVLQFMFLSFELFQIIFSAGEILFLDFEWVGFISLSFQKVSDYIGNLDFVYLYISSMAIVINSSFMISTVRHSYNKANLMLDIIVGVLGIAGCYGLTLLSLRVNLAIMLFISIAGGILILWLGKEYIYARKTRE